ncbi:unnamed protein product [Tuber aestivum]|uniref:Uncharacterized protein n=1 Tax=Tuber aestivum TaxID=59557 RepID=A0A292PK27_9PEZI|nr:unnamed protein product [Tuber aestivum]
MSCITQTFQKRGAQVDWRSASGDQQTGARMEQGFRELKSEIKLKVRQLCFLLGGANGGFLTKAYLGEYDVSARMGPETAPSTKVLVEPAVVESALVVKQTK